MPTFRSKRTGAIIDTPDELSEQQVKDMQLERITGGVANRGQFSGVFTEPERGGSTRQVSFPNILDDVLESERTGVVGGDGRLRDQENQIKGEAGNMLDELESFGVASTDISDITTDILGAETFAETEAGKKALADLNDARAALGILSPDEIRQIELEAIGAGAQFDPLIRQAEEQKRQGFAKARVGAGEVGGFMSTQFAGVAALFPTVGEDFAGAGGKLEQIKSVYDNNISQLRARKEAAMQQARTAARQAIRTGKRDDFDSALQAFDAARTIHEDSIRLANEKVDAISRIQDIVAKQRELESVDPFFRSQDLVSIAKELKEGETREITDPNTGTVYTIEGLAQDEPNTQTFRSTNKNTGDETFTTIDKNTGLILNQEVSKGTGERFKPTGTTPGAPSVKFSQNDIQTLVGAGFTSSEIDQIQADVNEFGLDAVLAGMTEEQRGKVSGLFKTKEEEKDRGTFLTKDFLLSQFNEDQLVAQAKEEGITGVFKSRETEINEYLDLLLKRIQAWRDAGFTDEEILKRMK